jgi:hypothetical protein
MRAGDLRAPLDAYLAVRRAVGFAMRPEARLLRDFIAFLERRGLDHPVGAQAALDWATSTTPRCGPGGQARRLSVAPRVPGLPPRRTPGG